MKEKKGFLLTSAKQAQKGAIVSGIGFLLYIAAAALGQQTAAGVVAIVFGVIAVYVLVSVLCFPKDEGTYSLTWGQTALTLLLCACAVLNIKLWLGL